MGKIIPTEVQRMNEILERGCHQVNARELPHLLGVHKWHWSQWSYNSCILDFSPESAETKSRRDLRQTRLSSSELTYQHRRNKYTQLYISFNESLCPVTLLWHPVPGSALHRKPAEQKGSCWVRESDEESGLFDLGIQHNWRIFLHHVSMKGIEHTTPKMPLGYIILSLRQLKKSRCRKGSLISPFYLKSGAYISCEKYFLSQKRIFLSILIIYTNKPTIVTLTFH